MGRPDELAASLRRIAAKLDADLAGQPFGYALMDRTPVPLGAAEWLAWMVTIDPDDDAWRRVGLDVVETPQGQAEVSTVFLLAGARPDGLFETMVSGPGGQLAFERYASWDAAAAGHRAAVAAVRRSGWPFDE